MGRMNSIKKFLNRTRLAGTALVLSTLFLTPLFGSTAAAATAKFTISPTSGTVTQGSTIEFTIQAVPAATDTYAVQACVVYDSAKLSLDNVDYSSDPLPSNNPSAPSSDCSAGQAQLGRNGINGSNVTHATGTFTVAVVRFKALQSSGIATISFDDAKSFIDSATPSGSDSASITLAAVPAAPATPAPTSPAPTNTTPAKKTTPISSSTAGSTAAITDSGRSVADTAQATSSDVKVPQSNQTVTAANSATKGKSRRVLYIVVGAVVLAIAAAAALIKFVGLPFGRGRGGGNPFAGGSDMTPPSTPDADPPIDVATVAGPDIPPPSSVVTPNDAPTKRIQ
jgi:hypothetical protein